MEISLQWNFLALLLFLLWKGGEVQCGCPDDDLHIQGGNYTLTKHLESGSVLEYHCPEGYYPYPKRTRRCRLNGSWDPPPKRNLPSKCRLVECPNPRVFQYGSVFPPQRVYYVDNVTTYECYSGYTLRGSTTRICLPNGKWDGFTPICSLDSGDRCADPGIPPGASREGNEFGFQDKVVYRCDRPLFLVGSEERMCQENGFWTATEPACYYEYTFDRPEDISQAFGNAIKDSLTTLQPVDDIESGRTIRVSKGGILNIYIAVDISDSIGKTDIDRAKNAVIALIDKISSFSVSPNYEIIFFSSEVYEVADIIKFLDGRVKLDSVIRDIKSFTIEDKSPGTDLSKAFKKIETQMALIRENPGKKSFREHRHVIIGFTDGAYNEGGPPQPIVQRIKDMVHMNQESRKDYLDIYIFGIGAEIFDNFLQPLTAGTGTGEHHYFRLDSNVELQKIFEEIIEVNEEVNRLCGLHQTYKSTASRKMYPWFAFIQVVTDSFRKNCLGALVSPRFVLTAAHCIHGYLPRDITVEIDDGGNRVKAVKQFWTHQDYNTRAKQNLNIQEFYDYDVALIKLEKDVQISNQVRPICVPCTSETNAALQLPSTSSCRDQAVISMADDGFASSGTEAVKEAFPVTDVFLLPLFVSSCSRSTCSKTPPSQVCLCLSSSRGGTGFPSREPLGSVAFCFLPLPSDIPPEELLHLSVSSFLIAESEDSCSSSPFQFFTSCPRKECIDKAIGVGGITKETVGEAVTDNFLCTGGLDPQTDYIACTGDSGGAVFKNFKHRTVQLCNFNCEYYSA
ncbi:complement factor B-like [Pholidichthys leucotaenia]